MYNINDSQHDMELFEQGYEKKDENIYIVTSGRASAPATRIVIDENSYNKPSKVINSNKYGMAHWLDVAFNLTIGSYTKKTWKAATILGVNPSEFLNVYKKGDMLEKSESMVKREKWVQVKTSAGYVNAGRATKESITVFVDLRTTKRVNGELKPYRKSDSKNFTNITKYYNNESELKASTLSYACIGNNVVSFYEDPFVK